MTRHGRGADDARLVRALAELFDELTPASRREAEEELQSVRADPGAVGRRFEQLAGEMLGAHAAPAGVKPEQVALTPRGMRGRPRLLWLAAASIAGLGLAWALLRPPPFTPSAPGMRRPEQRRIALPRQDVPPSEQIDAGPRGAPAAQLEQSRQDPAVEVAEAPAELDQLEVDAALPPITSAEFDVAPGTVITANGIPVHGRALSAGVEWALRNGLQIRVVDPRPVALPRAYRAATAQHDAGVGLAPDGRSLEGYVAGLPFPHVDVNDPHAGVKVMWNHAYGPFATDDFQAHDMVLESGRLGQRGEGMSIERQVVFGSLRRLFYNGRLFTEPRPELPNRQGIRYREGWFPIRDPLDLRGLGMITVRYEDAARPDDTWLYLPSLRRVRRLSMAQRSEAHFDQEIDADSLLGFSAKVTSMSWSLLGERVILACMHAENSPLKWGAAPGDFAFDDVWEPRRVFVVAGVPEDAYGYGKRVLYIDQETWVVLLADLYDRGGTLRKAWLGAFSAPPQAGSAAGPGASIAAPGGVMIDMQLQRATRMRVGGHAGSPGWSFNQGTANEDQFTIATMIDAAK